MSEAERTTPAPESATITFPQCPAWCTTGAHQRHELTTETYAGERIVSIGHDGPKFDIDGERAFHAGGYQGNNGAWELFVYPPEEGDPVGPEGARMWADAAVAAAEWLEAHR